MLADENVFDVLGKRRVIKLRTFRVNPRKCVGYILAYRLTTRESTKGQTHGFSLFHERERMRYGKKSTREHFQERQSVPGV